MHIDTYVLESVPLERRAHLKNNLSLVAHVGVGLLEIDARPHTTYCIKLNMSKSLLFTTSVNSYEHRARAHTCIHAHTHSTAQCPRHDVQRAAVV